jgi:hypothetical protein
MAGAHSSLLVSPLGRWEVAETTSLSINMAEYPESPTRRRVGQDAVATASIKLSLFAF